MDTEFGMIQVLGGAGKRERSDSDDAQEEREGVGVETAAAEIRLLTGLPGIVIQKIVELQKHKERLVLRLVCRSLHDEVETFCEEAFARIKRDHRVDDTFDDRVRNQTNVETTRFKPVPLPFCYLLWKAAKIYLYKLESPELNNFYDSACYNLFASQDFIAITANGVNTMYQIRLWDLRTRRLGWVIDEEEILDEFFIGNRIVCCANNGNIHVRNPNDGTLVAEYSVEETRNGGAIYNYWAAHQEKIFFAADLNHIHCFDVRVGEVRMNVFSSGVDTREYAHIRSSMAVSGCGWLTILIDGYKRDDERSRVNEIHVFDLAGAISKRVFRGAKYQGGGLEKYPSISEGCKLLFQKEQNGGSNDVMVLDLTDGSLSRNHHFSFGGRGLSKIVPLTPQYFLALFYNDDDYEETVVYNTETGEKERVLVHEADAQHCVVSKARQEIYLGLGHDNLDNDDNSGPTIAAFCLMKP